MRALTTKGIPFAIVVALAFTAAGVGIFWHRSTPTVLVVNHSSSRLTSCLLRVDGREVHVGAVEVDASVAASLGTTGMVEGYCRFASGLELSTGGALRARRFDRIVLEVGISDLVLRRRDD